MSLSKLLGLRAVARKFRVVQEKYFRKCKDFYSSRFSQVLNCAFDLFALALKLSYSCVVTLIRVVIVPPLKSIEGETILITGAGDGIGRELAIQMAELGATIICWDSNSCATVKEILEKGGQCFGYNLDVTERDQVLSVAKCMRQRFSEITMVISNSSMCHEGSIASTRHDITKRILDNNLLAHFWIIQAFLPGMISGKRGHFVAINSSAGLVPFSGFTPYCAAKFGLRGLMEALSEELRLDTLSREVQVSSVYLAGTSTGMYSTPVPRFRHLCPEISLKEAAERIIDGIRRNYQDISIPSAMMQLISLNQLLPHRLRIIMSDFCNFGHHRWFDFC